jgi:hypothetical protein
LKGGPSRDSGGGGKEDGGGKKIGENENGGEKEHEGGKEDGDVETKAVAFNPESPDFPGILYRVYSYS